MPTGVYIRTEYHIKINSNCHKGLPSPNKDKPMSEATKKKISDAQRGISKPKKSKVKPLSQQHKNNISKSMLGKNSGKFGKNSFHWKGGKKFAIARANQKRRHGLFGFIPLNDCSIDGWAGHHLDYNYVIFIPEELHKSVYHSVTKDINMDIINDKVYDWFVDYYRVV